MDESLTDEAFANLLGIQSQWTDESESDSDSDDFEEVVDGRVRQSNENRSE